ncbi:glycosyltransferase [Aquipluma nitroreducens]|uniref:Glycosyltransferase n=1 Tax=Aquipluma nitroreducens TaxID=2010828 RepID=A0A5K7SBR5_9BACT|nr:glycosyltransferase family 4 protein [Aquipluma nitroreducens]BBE19000.1 glycosyltransferase [Aquipluma nitroreducens]
MKVLMFGWEFPPHISGGLGTACYGLTKGLAQLKDVEVTFVVPKAWGDEDRSNINLLGADQIPVVHQQIQFDNARSKVEYYELQSGLIPYLGTSEFDELKSEISSGEKQLIELTPEGKFVFSGDYGQNLFQEIANYTLIAGKLAREIDFDVIHVHDWMCFQAGMAVKRVSGKPLVVHVHSTEFDRSGSSVNPAICAIEKEGLDAADKIITVSNLTRSVVIEKYNIIPEKVITVYNAVEPVRSGDAKTSREYTNDKVVSFLGRITMQKGPEYFVEAASLVLQKMRNVRFVMAGKGDLLNEMKQKVSALDISSYFHFPGFVGESEIAELFQASDVFVMPSVSEPFGIVTLEAMQAGVPVVISKQSGVSEVVQNAIKVDYWDIQAMADAIYTLLINQEYGIRLGEKGKKEADKLIWKNVASEVNRTYLKLLEVKPKHN